METFISIIVLFCVLFGIMLPSFISDFKRHKLEKAYDSVVVHDGDFLMFKNIAQKYSMRVERLEHRVYVRALLDVNSDQLVTRISEVEKISPKLYVDDDKHGLILVRMNGEINVFYNRTLWKLG